MDSLESLLRKGKGGKGGKGGAPMYGDEGSTPDMAKQAENMWKYLDKLAENPEDYQKFMAGQMAEGKKMQDEHKEQQMQDATAEVWRVAKTSGELGRTVVVLMRSSQKVAAPSSMGDDRVPVWVGSAKLGKDEAGNPVTVYDAVFHPEIQARAKGAEEAAKRFTRAVVALAIDSIAETHGVIIDGRGFKLVKKKDHAQLCALPFSWEQHGGGTYGQDEDPTPEKGVFESSPLLSELSTLGAGPTPPRSQLAGETSDAAAKASSAPTKPLIQVVSETPSAVETPQYRLGSSAEDEEPATLLTVWLPGVTSVQDVDLEVGSTEACVSVEERYELILELPVPVDPDELSAKFDKCAQSLSLRLPHI